MLDIGSDTYQQGEGCDGMTARFYLHELQLTFVLSQILFIDGIIFIIGLDWTYQFFQAHKLKGTAFFMGGILIVLMHRVAYHWHAGRAVWSFLIVSVSSS